MILMESEAHFTHALQKSCFWRGFIFHQTPHFLPITFGCRLAALCFLSSSHARTSFASGAGNSFTVNGPKIGRDSLLIGAGAAVQLSDRISVGMRSRWSWKSGTALSVQYDVRQSALF